MQEQVRQGPLAADAGQWEDYAHDADVGIRGYGLSPAAAFEQAALAMTAVAVDPAAIAPREMIEIECAAPDDELLLVDWLNALIYEMAQRRMCFGRFQVTLDDHRLHGCAWGEAVDVARHELGVEVKGATYTDLRVAREPSGLWVAQCVVDV
jgi:tRNA nucleotidyltransferase (CCA-adding enzyme)